MLRNIFKTVINLYLLLLLTQQSIFAADFSLGISPTLNKIQAKNNSTVSIDIELENFSEKPIILTPIFKEFKASDTKDGQIEFIPNSPELTKLLSLATFFHKDIPITQLTLAPRQKISLELHIPILKDTPKQDFTFSVVFIDNRSVSVDDLTTSSVSILKGGVATNILLTVGENETPQAIIEEFSTQKIFQQGPVPFTLIIRNPGQHLITPIAVIEIRNVFAQLVGKVEIAEKNVLAGSSRILSFSPEHIDNINKSNTVSSLNNTLTESSIWPEKYILGPYQANLQVKISNDGPTYNRNIYFMAFPYKSVIVFILTFTFIILIAKRVSKHLTS